MHNLNEQTTCDQAIRRYECEECGENYWSTKDVCELLEIQDVDQVIAELEPVEKNVLPVKSDKGESAEKEIDVVSSQGLFSLLLQSQAPIAREFRRWVTRDVLFEALSPIGAIHEINMSIKDKLLELELLPCWACCI